MLRLALLTLLLLPASAEASSLATACRALTNGDSTLTKKCVSHGEFFEVKASLVQGCTSFHGDVEIRMRCLKSGADTDILRLCQSAGWTLDGTLTCLRAYPTEPVIKSCKKLSPEEDEQIRCVRLGREAAQIDSCREMSFDPAARFQCLQMDVPVFEARRCTVSHKTVSKRMGCLENFVARREGEYLQDQRELKRSLASSNEDAPAPTGHRAKGRRQAAPH